MNSHKSILVGLIILFWCFGVYGQTTLETALIARKLAPIAVTTAKDVASISTKAIKILSIPRGLAQLGLAPLPGPTIGGGLKDVGYGIKALFDVTQKTAQLPFRTVNRTVNVAKNGLGNLGDPLSYIDLN